MPKKSVLSAIYPYKDVNIPSQQSKQPWSLLGFIWNALSPVRFYVFCLLFVSTVTATMIALEGYVIRFFINFITSQSILWSDIIYFVLVFIAWWECVNLIWRGYGYLIMKILPTMKASIIHNVIDYTLNHSHKFFQAQLPGSVANKITELSSSAAKIVEIFIGEIYRKFFMVIFAFFVLYFTNKVFAFIFIIWCGIFMAVSIFFMKDIANYSNLLAVSKMIRFGKISDTLNNIGNVRIFTNQDFEIKYLKKYLQDTQQSESNLRIFEVKIDYFKGLLNSLLIGSMACVLCILYLNNEITIGDFSLILVISISLCNEIWTLVKAMSKFTEELGICNQALTLINQPHDVEDILDAKPLYVRNGDIEFRNVKFKYLKEALLFDNLSVQIKGGSKVGLVGYSGSGKTSFASLIIRLFDLNEGQILIDGQDIKTVTQDSLRAHIALIPQDPVLFHRSIMDNIRYGMIYATDNDVIEAAKFAHAHDFIMRTEYGYNTIVGTNGLKISGGQKQRIAIARAILKRAPILVFDEATSALDSLVEKAIQDTLTHLMKDKTTLVIAHKLSTLLNMDRIIVFDKGKIAEDGTHKELLKKRGLYAHLWATQINGFIVDKGE